MILRYSNEIDNLNVDQCRVADGIAALLEPLSRTEAMRLLLWIVHCYTLDIDDVTVISLPAAEEPESTGSRRS